VTPVNCPSASGLFRDTVTPGSTPPLESTIFPVTVPVVERWANAAPGTRKTTRRSGRRARTIITSS